MATKLTNLRVLGERVARAQDGILQRGSAAGAARALWMSSCNAPFTTAIASRRRSVWGISIPAAAVLMLLAYVLARRSPLGFEVGPSVSAGPGTQPAQGVLGEWIAAPQQAALPLRFSDGSLILLERDSRARVAQVASSGASVVLESGSAAARIVHRPGARWTVHAGPFDVHVVGTAFEVTWDPHTELFTLVLSEGKVLVSGCLLPAGRVVAAHETFRATCHEGRILASAPAVLPPASPASDLYGAPSLTALPPDSVSGRPHDTPRRDRAASVRSSPLPTWRDLLARDRYAEATDAAEAEGLAAVCSDADMTELMALGDAARFAKRTDAAQFIWRGVRERFAGQPAASVAAFDLGRTSFDDRASYPEAAGWFRTYLTEQPAGPLAREALGRLLESLDRQGDHDGARQAAARYLQAFPNGPHAGLARRLVDR